jgi:molybdopterin-containing oxidoreductase family iron-sulfur binding subunit
MAGEEAPKRYWKSLPERDADPHFLEAAEAELPQGPAAEHGLSRRDFLRATGFALAGTALAGCQQAPVQQALPLLIQPEGVVPGRADYYASTCAGCSAGCGLLAKVRDGRPIKLEGNPEHPLSQGGLCAVGQASLLGLYDSLRLQHPLHQGRQATWPEVDGLILQQLDAIRQRRGKVRVLSGTITSPTTRALIARLLARFPEPPDVRQHVVHDPLSSSAILDAHRQTHGARVLPRYLFERAEVLVSFDADFLGTWIAPVEFAAGYHAGRTPAGTPPRCSFHVQFESRLSLTGCKADQRVLVAPGELGLVMTHLARRLAERAGVPFTAAGAQAPPIAGGLLDRLAARLWQARGRSLVVCGSQDVADQLLCNLLNHLLDNYGATLDVARPSYQRQGDDAALEVLRDELRQRRVEALFLVDCNPAYDLPWGNELATLLRSVHLVVCCAERLDETARLARYVCPHPHYLASWSDAEPVAGVVSLSQPTLRPLGDTRPLLESLAAWSELLGPPGLGASTAGLLSSPFGQGPVLAASALCPGRPGVPQSAYELIRSTWEAEVFPRYRIARTVSGASTLGLVGSSAGGGPLLASSALVAGGADRRNDTFQAFWDHTLHEGFARVAPREEATVHNFDLGKVEAVLQARRPAEGTFSLVLYPKVGILDGRHAYNPWLQELPDPVSKVTWDNYACLAPATASRLGLHDGDVVRLEATGPGAARALELPVLVQPGQHDGVVAVALGYGSAASARFSGIGPRWLEARPTLGAGGLVGVNAAPLLGWGGGTLRFARDGVRLTPLGRRQPLASTQDHHAITVPRHLAQPGHERRPAVQEMTVAALNAARNHPPGHQEPERPDLWPEDHPTSGYRWGMVIDLAACTGCSACVVACQVENNIPVVGKDEVSRHREMHWLRIDRYYSGEGGEVDVAHQPMLCQQCGNAPCETVCPVLATVHSTEGLNQQVYNRCVGTRYCANNCPYKVRRFNWFEYARDDTLQNLVLNPDVTVRSRGVMEKCTFCVQRIQEAKIEARRQGLPLADGAIQPACQQSCPAQAIVFGDLNDPRSQVARLARDGRGYQVLAELNVRPSVTYLKGVRNRAEEGGGRG